MKILWEFIDFFVFFIETLILFKYLKVKITQKYSEKYNWIWVMTISFMSYLFSRVKAIEMLHTPIIYVVVLLFIAYLYQDKIQKKLIAFGTFLILNIAIENVIIFLLISGFKISIAQLLDNTLSKFIGIIITKILLFLLVTFYVQKKSRNFFSLSSKTNTTLIFKIATLVTTIIFIMILILNVYKIIDEVPNRINIFVYLFVLSFAVVCILSVSIYEDILRESEEQMKLNLLIQQNEKEYKYNQEIAATVDSIRAIKHDMSNHLAVISGYIQCNKYEQAKKYIHNLYQPIEGLNDLLNIDHPVISSILYVKSMLAKKSNIILDIDFNLETNVQIQDMDLTILLGNIVDNAIEACNKVPLGTREISLEISTVQDYFLVDCINTMNVEKIKYEKNRFFTTKEDAVNHGIGLKNIKGVVDKYEGDMKIQLLGNQFSIKTTMSNVQ